jgi:hypothetical protein
VNTGNIVNTELRHCIGMGNMGVAYELEIACSKPKPHYPNGPLIAIRDMLTYRIIFVLFFSSFPFAK